MSSYFMAKKPLSSVQPPCLLIGSGFRNCPTAFWYVGDYHGLCLTSQIILRHERHDMSPKYPHSRHPITTTSYKERGFLHIFHRTSEVIPPRNGSRPKRSSALHSAARSAWTLRCKDYSNVEKSPSTVWIWTSFIFYVPKCGFDNKT